MRVPVSWRVGIAIATGVVVAAALPGAPLVPTAPTASAAPAGKIVFLDPGHSGISDPAAIGRQVTNGRGGTKNCQTSGTATNSGYPEHSFAWDTTLRIRAALNSAGVRTAMSRGDDNGPGPCVDARAAMANTLHPDAIVSIHADGGPAGGRGFHVNYSAPALNPAQEGPAVRFAQVMRSQLQAAGIPPANYIGTDGLKGRADLAGLNLAEYPSILVELGNMKNPTDAALMESPAGRQRYADAVARGIAAYLG
ncbi:Rv3717 family N-acetylmuramoyl-L-alanine amidase [[Mycobacterium] vasticus]|uniref:Rv3717 family N-acetylmuramoyl-L-alanine amidase n=1 Tax=[Mycobacterium] vasticus TaxID=2875777 RepID=A0ABU5Z0Y9_9MYCO|nr:Rv3717 family N-acetylmuramoyl-L-alanine amidase [Mycolicibacter sp. MYC017]MEB3070560.1 Rv3717 family N-acetylmuramoyl-L-alanine amidase [Mycolicibacter sp. MYC017]